VLVSTVNTKPARMRRARRRWGSSRSWSPRKTRWQSTAKAITNTHAWIIS